jgi:uncharacterized protein YmfQ (DUF2313 family)
MIIVSFSEIADVPPQNVQSDILKTVLQDAQELIDVVSYESLTQTLGDWESDLFLDSLNPSDIWYTRALFCICLRGLRGEIRPNILNLT